MSDHLSRAKEFASEKFGDLSEALSTHQKVRHLQRQIADLVAERDRVMIEIGRKVYALYGREKVRNADILPLCGRIDEIGQRVDALNVQVRELAQPKPKGVLSDVPLTDDSELAAEADEVEAAAETEAEPTAEEPEADAPAAESDAADDAPDDDAEAE
jgi:seryl-tRNA synthetase